MLQTSLVLHRQQAASFYGGPSAISTPRKGGYSGCIEYNATQDGTTDGVGGAEAVVDTSGAETTQAQKLEPLTLVELEAGGKKITAEPVMGAECINTERYVFANLLSENQGDLVVNKVAQVGE